MTSSRIPEGWEYVTSDPDWDDAWDIAVTYKGMHERARDDVFVRVTVIKAAQVYWILRRLESREEREKA